jgi:hypothetical protein
VFRAAGTEDDDPAFSLLDDMKVKPASGVVKRGVQGGDLPKPGDSSTGKTGQGRTRRRRRQRPSGAKADGEEEKKTLPSE